MNNKFEEPANGLVQSVTRRQALKRFSVGLGGIALAGVADERQLRALAQSMGSQPKYTTFDFPGAAATIATDLNVSGQIIGEYTFTTMGARQGYLLSKGVFTSISFPGAPFTRALGINKFGDIVGDYQKAGNNHGNGNDFGYLLRGGVYTSIAFPNSDLTVPAGISASGDIVGWYLDKVGRHGFLLSGGVYTSIDVPGSAEYTEAWKINDSGQIVGRYVSASDGNQYVFVLSNGVFTTLPSVPGATNNAAVEDGGLNNSGDIKWLDPDTLSKQLVANPKGPRDVPWIQLRTTAPINPATPWPP
jgi:uncharacterized membrane protein